MPESNLAHWQRYLHTCELGRERAIRNIAALSIELSGQLEFEYEGDTA